MLKKKKKPKFICCSSSLIFFFEDGFCFIVCIIIFSDVTTDVAKRNINVMTSTFSTYHKKRKTITKTYLYNFDPLKPHFYIVKLGFTGVYIIFLISTQNIDCGYSLEPPGPTEKNIRPRLKEYQRIPNVHITFKIVHTYLK